ncbi:MAG: hypothetical protein AAGH99_13180 [Planctomycetota bacterium]
MRRGASTQSGNEALELFLDAMSNMFGGVVFIAVIVVILLQFTVLTDSETENPTPGVVATQSYVEALREEVEVLRRLANPDRSRNAAINSERQTAAEKIVAEMETLNITVERSRQDLAQLQQQLERERVSSQELQNRRDQLEAQLLEVRTAIDAASARPPDRLRIPRFNQTNKKEVPFLLSGNRLISVFDLSTPGQVGPVKLENLQIDEQGQTVAARPGRGLLIGDSDDGRRSVLSLFSQLDPSSHYVALAVWPDSFSQAVTVRDTLIDLGFEYGLTPIPANGSVPFRAVGGVQ